jgi:hypothetical protein
VDQGTGRSEPRACQTSAVGKAHYIDRSGSGALGVWCLETPLGDFSRRWYKAQFRVSRTSTMLRKWKIGVKVNPSIDILPALLSIQYIKKFS